MFKRIPGTKDILPEETLFWQGIEAASRRIFSLYNYKEIRPPLMEEAALFQRSLGEGAEIVQKQMFLIAKDDDVYVLRPEGTASIVRAYIENNLDKAAGVAKLYYMGAMFRRERPQKGRLRQFHHLGCEAIGSSCAGLDVEIISLADSLLQANSVEGYKIKVNSLGCAKDKKALVEALRKSLKDKLSGLCPDCHIRFQNNVLRILDCKNEKCIEQVRKLDMPQDYLCADCKSHFTEVKGGLDNLKIEYRVDPYLVRGLDYYTRTVFEITHDGLGSQDAVGAGGRYDKLVAELGGPQVGAIGFAFGIERLLLVSKFPGVKVSGQKLVYIITLGEEAKKQGLELLHNLRKAGICADTDYADKSLKGALRRANDLKARYVLIIGEDEIKKGIVAFKDMVSGEQKEIKPGDLITELKK